MLPAIAQEAQVEDVVYQLAATANWGQAPRGLCFAARLSGLYVSEDDGENWGSAYRSLDLTGPLATLAVAVAPNGRGKPAVLAGFNGGLLRSSDGGQSWETITFPAPPPCIASLVISPNYAQDGFLIAGTLEDGTYYSADRGAHWKTGNMGLIDPNILCLALSPSFESDQTVFAGTQSGLFRSHNAGRSWREVELPIEPEAILSLALSPDFGEDGMLFAGTESRGLLRSLDRGQTWQRTGQPALKHSINQILLSPHFARQPWALVLHEGSVLLSKNGGQSWQPWKRAPRRGEAVTALLAPMGFGPDAPALVGFEGGDTIRV